MIVTLTSNRSAEKADAIISAGGGETSDLEVIDALVCRAPVGLSFMRNGEVLTIEDVRCVREHGYDIRPQRGS